MRLAFRFRLGLSYHKVHILILYIDIIYSISNNMESNNLINVVSLSYLKLEVF